MNRKTILLIEDNLYDTELTKLALERSGIPIELVVCRLGEDGLDYLWSRGGCNECDDAELPALILLDLELPRMSGVEVLRRARADLRSKRAVIIVLSASVDPKDIAACYDIGVNAYMQKPLDSRKYVDLVQQLCVYWLTLNEAPRLK